MYIILKSWYIYALLQNLQNIEWYLSAIEIIDTQVAWRGRQYPRLQKKNRL